MVKILFFFSLLKGVCCHLFLASAAPRLAPFLSVITICCIQGLFTVEIFLFDYISAGSLLALFLSYSFQDKLSLGITAGFLAILTAFYCLSSLNGFP